MITKSNANRHTLILLAWTVACVLLRAHAANSFFLVDQRHDLSNAYEGYHNIRAYPPVQEFVPSVGALDAVDIWTLDLGYPSTNGAGATLQASILSDAVNGTVLAESEPVVLPDNWDGPSRFVLREQLLLEPGRSYAIALRVLDGDTWGIRNYGELFPSYPFGRYFIGGIAVDSFDIWFRTIVNFVPPFLAIDSHRTIRWQGIPSLPYTVWRSADLSHWSIAGTARASSRDFSFSEEHPDSGALFYRVSYP
jgi:hypothetical protein